MIRCKGSLSAAFEMVSSCSLLTLAALFVAQLAVVALAAEPTFYCSRWAVADGNNVTGFFAMQLINNTAAYSYSLELEPTAPMLAQCPSVANVISGTNASTGLKFHFHSLWKWGDAKNAGVGAECNATFLAGHYDPNLACGPQSTWAGSTCQTLSRTAGAGYTYACTPPQFLARPGACELGDLSGKFGQAVVTQAAPASPLVTVQGSGMYTFDELPPYAADFYRGNGTALEGWSSMLFHCGDAAAARLFCARVVAVAAWSDCASDAFPVPPVAGGAGGDSSGAGGEDLTTDKDTILGVVLTVLSLTCIVVTHLHLKGMTLEDY